MKNKKKRGVFRALSALLSGVLLCLCLTTAMPNPAAAATSLDDLKNQLQQYEEKLKQDKQVLAEMKQNTADAKQRKQHLESQVDTLKKQINVLMESISTVQNDIGNTQAAIDKTQVAIDAKQEEITTKEADIDQRRENFKQRMAAMQELHDSGAMAMLANVKTLYQLLTFSEVLQDIANKDTEILDDLRTEKEELEAAKAELETAKSALEAKKAEKQRLEAELNRQKQSMNSKQDELGVALKDAGKDVAEAAAAQAEIQEMLESDQLNYESLQKQIEALINSATEQHSDLSFNGSFGCPMASGTFRLGSLFGMRTINGKQKMHYGVDMPAASGTPIYAAADGYVTAAGWNSGGYGNYVLIYHGKMSDGNTYTTLYAHMVETPSVSAGQYVKRGDQIGKVGTTGNSQGNHLHLELWQGSNVNNSVANKATRINPAAYIPMK